jgi:hypothetical protein
MSKVRTLLTDQQRLSVAADFGVTQVVDGRQGIRLRMPGGCRREPASASRP